ncbi:MAG: MFS transporter [Actinomycetota bacterium]|nr:MFS transporter [Actinomycetota bacterium]
MSASPGLLIAARVAQGASAAFAQATALSLIVSTFPAGRARNRAVGVFAAMKELGAAAGLLPGGVLVQAVSWRWVFFLNVPVAAVVAVLAPRMIPPPSASPSVSTCPERSPPVPGSACSSQACPGPPTTAGPACSPPGPSPSALPAWPRSCCWNGAAPSRSPRYGCSPAGTGAAPT